jgi:UDP-N-acetylmuramate--alanine ligase
VRRALDLSVPRRVHVVGAGGAGMSAIAAMLASMGHTVSGCDLKGGGALERLRAHGVEVVIGHDPAHLEGVEVLTRSTAVRDTNPEVEAARARGLEVVSRAEVLAAIAGTRRSVGVAGTHGKTTTTSMLWLVLVEAGLRPSLVVGGDVNEVGSNAVHDEGDWLVVEADESDGTFLELPLAAGVVTSVEADHLDHYGSLAALEEAFVAFGRRVETLVVWSDDEGAKKVARAADGIGVGTRPSARFVVRDVELGPRASAFRLDDAARSLGRFELAVPGAHNVANGALAAAAAVVLGADPEAARRGLARFGGVARRFEARGEAGGVRFVDDYAHLPTEVRAAIATARLLAPRRVVAVFQPHRYSRTAALAEQFAHAFDDADLVFVTEVYPAGESPVPGVTGRAVAEAVARRGGVPVEYVDDTEELSSRLVALLGPGDLCLTLGAGDLTSLPDELQRRLA